MRLIFTAVVMAIGVVIPANLAFAGCEQSLPNALQACFNSNQLGLQVSEANGYLIISGGGNAVTSVAMNCIDIYNNDASSCPGAPSLYVSVSMQAAAQPSSPGNR